MKICEHIFIITAWLYNHDEEYKDGKIESKVATEMLCSKCLRKKVLIWSNEQNMLIWAWEVKTQTK